MATPKEYTGITYDNFWIVAQGHSAFQLMWAGVELKVFDLLQEHPHQYQTGTLGQALGLEKSAAKILIDGLLALQLILIHEEDQSLHNAPLTSNYLTTKSPVSLTGMLGWQHHIVYKAGGDFVDALRSNKNIGLRHFPGEGNTLYQRLASDPPLQGIFQKAMTSFSEAANSYLVDHLDLHHRQHLMDYGGGRGTNAIKFAKKFPALKVTVFDLPSVCAEADINIHQHFLNDRIQTYPGDFFESDYPPNIDCVLYAHIVTIWSPEKNIELLTRIYDALPSKGSVHIFSTLSNEDPYGPVSTALASVYFQTIATGEGRIPSQQEVRSYVEAAGFEVTEVVEMPLDHVLVTGTKP